MVSDRPEKHKLVRGRKVFASDKVFLNSIRLFLRRSVSANQRSRRPSLNSDLPEKHKLVRGR